MNNVDPDFWRARWGEGRIGFHEGAPNGLLTKHGAHLGEGKRVFIPLCGKAEDLAFLAAQGHQVVGVELVEAAVQAFFEEHRVEPVVSKRGAFVQYAAQNITLFVGDYFACSREVLGEVNAFYDRAAMIALPESMRGAYVKLLREVLPLGSPGIVITVEYAQEQMEPPPFSVPEVELRAHYFGATLECVAQVKAEGMRLGALHAVEKCFTVSL